MLGAIIGDIVGSRFEWNNIKTKEFELFVPKCDFTDDSVMTVAIADAIMRSKKDISILADYSVESMQMIGRPFPDCGYGGKFYHWMYSDNPQPYGSFGNGAAMRVSACGFAADTLEEAKEMAFDVTCQGSVPQALEAFFESENFEDAIRNAVSIGGDSDTIAAITGGIAEAYYGIPEEIKKEALLYLDVDLLKIVERFYGYLEE